MVWAGLVCATPDPSDEPSALIVGNFGKAGHVEPYVRHVDQEHADFSYTEPLYIDGKAIDPLKIYTCDPEWDNFVSKKRTTHFKQDFTTLETPLHLGKPLRFNIIVFEWLGLVQHNLVLQESLLYEKSIERAFSLLKPGGKLYIDMNPRSAILDDGENIDLMQRMVPFFAILGKTNIRYFAASLETNTEEFLPVLVSIIADLSRVFEEDRDLLKTKLMQALKFVKEIPFSSFSKMPEDHQKYFWNFVWFYHMHKNRDLMLEVVRKKGFTVDVSAVRLHEFNPFNRRRWAWIIEATHPSA